MATSLLVVSRLHPDLYRTLRKRLSGDAQAEVILDRRWKNPSWIPAGDGGERRCRPHLDETLKSRSHVIVALA